MAVILTSAGRAYADAIIEVIAGLNKCPGCSPIEKAERQPCADSPLASRSQHVIASAPVCRPGIQQILLSGRTRVVRQRERAGIGLRPRGFAV